MDKDASFENAKPEREEYELKYFLSTQAIKYVENEVWGKFSASQMSMLSQFKSKINGMSLDSLLNYVYHNYQNMTEKSLIADKYIKR
ncbi:MAG: hypothetical protein LBM77_08150 [Spirochaetaceae bacterium]|nr:hypothetical protein [Spirochaetaceae bacterium]